jgi:hypothetical protein
MIIRERYFWPKKLQQTWINISLLCSVSSYYKPFSRWWPSNTELGYYLYTSRSYPIYLSASSFADRNIALPGVELQPCTLYSPSFQINGFSLRLNFVFFWPTSETWPASTIKGVQVYLYSSIIVILSLYPNTDCLIRYEMDVIALTKPGIWRLRRSKRGIEKRKLSVMFRKGRR